MVKRQYNSAKLLEVCCTKVFVSKKDGTKRLCCGYRKINLRILRDNFPMAIIGDVVQKLQGAKVFTILGMDSFMLQ